MAFHVLVHAHMGLTVLVVENACTELVDITSVMPQNLFNCIGVPSGRRRSPRAEKLLALVHRFLHTFNLPSACAPLVLIRSSFNDFALGR